MRFGDIAPQFWCPRSDYGVGPPLDDDALRAAEQKLGVRLPEDYVALLRIRNGGVVSDRFNAFPTSEPAGWGHCVEFHEMAGIGPGSMTTILDSPWLTEEWGLPRESVLLTGDGHWWIALDYRGDGEPSVVYLDTELQEDIQLAGGFRAFVEALVPEETFTPPPDLDHPPPKEYRHDGALSGVVMSLEMDIEALEEGQRSIENTKLWARARTADVRRHMWPWQTRRLRATLAAVDAARTREELVAHMRAIEPELDRLLPTWVRKRRTGWALDEQRLMKL
jgi:SMI1-KNR4 cell-wall